MKSQLNESKRMQQLAGILKESINEAKPKIINIDGIDFELTQSKPGELFFKFIDKKGVDKMRKIGTNQIVSTIQSRMDKSFGPGAYTFVMGKHAEFVGGYKFRKGPQDDANMFKEDEQSDSEKYKVGDILKFKKDGEEFIVTKVLPKKEKLFARPNDENTIKKYVKMDQEMTFDELENKVEKLQKIAGVIKEGEQTQKQLYDLQQQFLPAFEDYVELYAIAVLESQEGEYTELEKDFARQLKDVLFKLKKGVI